MINSILMIDDNEDDIYITNRILKKTGLVKHFESETNPEKALERLCSGDVPTLVLLDINMPALSGFELLEELENTDRSNKPFIVVMLSTSSNKEEIDRALKFDSVLDYFSKPLSAEDLQKIHASLQSKQLT